jgi:hypothetical protein
MKIDPGDRIVKPRGQRNFPAGECVPSAFRSFTTIELSPRMSFFLTPIGDFARRHKYLFVGSVVVASATAGYWAYQKLAPVIADVRGMLTLIQEQQELQSKKARELDPFVTFESLITNISMSMCCFAFLRLSSFDQNFRNNLDVCDRTIAGLIPPLRTKVIY